jgi:hypothetical protein
VGRLLSATTLGSPGATGGIGRAGELEAVILDVRYYAISSCECFSRSDWRLRRTSLENFGGNFSAARAKCLQKSLRHGIIGIVVAFHRVGVIRAGETERLPDEFLLVRLFH